MKSVTFTTRSGGDGECFCWKDISKEDMIGVLGKAEYEEELKHKIGIQKDMNEIITTPEPLPEAISILYPNDVLKACGVDRLEDPPDQKYKITVSVEKVE